MKLDVYVEEDVSYCKVPHDSAIPSVQHWRRTSVKTDYSSFAGNWTGDTPRCFSMAFLILSASIHA